MFAALVYLSLVGGVFNASAGTQPLPQKAEKANSSSLLRERVDMGALTFPSVDEALRQLARYAKARVNIQFFYDGDAAAKKAKAFNLTAQTSSVKQLLDDFKAAIPGLTWTADAKSITITVWRAKRGNPLDVPIASEVNRSFKASDLVLWMNLASMEDYGAFDSKQTCEMHLLPGVTRRDVITDFANKMQLRWIAQYSNVPGEGYITFAQHRDAETPKE